MGREGGPSPEEMGLKEADHKKPEKPEKRPEKGALRQSAEKAFRVLALLAATLGAEKAAEAKAGRSGASPDTQSLRERAIRLVEDEAFRKSIGRVDEGVPKGFFSAFEFDDIEHRAHTVKITKDERGTGDELEDAVMGRPGIPRALGEGFGLERHTQGETRDGKDKLDYWQVRRQIGDRELASLSLVGEVEVKQGKETSTMMDVKHSGDPKTTSDDWSVRTLISRREYDKKEANSIQVRMETRGNTLGQGFYAGNRDDLERKNPELGIAVERELQALNEDYIAVQAFKDLGKSNTPEGKLLSQALQERLLRFKKSYPEVRLKEFVE